MNEMKPHTELPNEDSTTLPASDVNERELERSGYRKWYESGLFSDFFYQKKFTDEKGTKYYGEFIHYPSISGVREAWTASLSNNEPHLTFEIHRPTSIEEVESRWESFFKDQRCEYYETV